MLFVVSLAHEEGKDQIMNSQIYKNKMASPLSLSHKHTEAPARRKTRIPNPEYSTELRSSSADICAQALIKFNSFLVKDPQPESVKCWHSGSDVSS